MENDSTTYKTLKNVSYSFLGFVWPIFFAVFVTPFIVFRLGVDNYGFYILLNTVNSLLGLLDLGVSAAVIKYAAEYQGAGDKASLQRLVRSANFVFLCVGLAGLVIMALVGLASFGLMGDGMTRAGYTSYFVVSGMIFFVNSINGVFVAIPSALQRLDVNNQLGMVKLLVLNVIIVAALLAGGGLMGVLVTYLCVDAAFLMVNVMVFRRLLPGTAFAPVLDSGEIKKCYKYGAGFFVSNWASQLLYHLDRLIIPFVLGPAALSYYSLPGTVATKVQGLNNSLSAIVFPMSSAFSGSGDKDRLRKVYIRSTRLLMVVAAGFSVAVASFAGEILRVWLDADFAAKSTEVLVILTVTYFFLALASPLNGFLMGLGRVRLMAGFSVLMTSVNAVALLLLLPRFGIVGAAWAYLISVLPVMGLFYYAERRVLGLTGRTVYYVRLIMKNGLCMALVYFVARHLLAGMVHGLFSLALSLGVAVSVYFVVYAALGFFEKEDLVTFKDFASAVFKRFALICRTKKV